MDALSKHFVGPF